MQPQMPNSGPESGEIQKKSVFDRLGRRFDTGYSMNRRSPYGEHQPPMPQMTNELEYNNNGRFVRDPIFDADWHYQNERRQMAINQGRHPPQYMPVPPHYEMDPPGRQPSYHTGMHSYHNSSARSSGPPMGPSILTMNPQQRRPSPKYDRHGNLMRGPMMRIDHASGMPPPGVFLPNPIMHINYDMGPLRQGPNLLQQSHKWLDNPDMGPSIALNRPHDQFLEPHRYQMSQQVQPPQALNNDGSVKYSSMAPRYTKWRERRDVITNLDRETAQSSSRTDSLKSTLQQTDKTKNTSQDNKNLTKQNESSCQPKVSSKKSTGQKTDSTKPPEKKEPQDISDGEIIDDEDSSEDSVILDNELSKLNRDERLLGKTSASLERKREALQVGYDPVKRRRIADRDDCAMDYETISDEELDVFMSEKKSTDKREDPSHKSSSEIELLKALGLDWAHLVEMSRQTKKESNNTTYSALRRFSLPNYLPTLGIKKELAGAEIYGIMERICN